MTGRMAAEGLPARLPIRSSNSMTRLRTAQLDRPPPQPLAKRSRRITTTTEDGHLAMDDAVSTDAGLDTLRRWVFDTMDDQPPW